MNAGFEGIQARSWSLPFAAIQSVEVMRNDCVREMVTDRVSQHSLSLRTDDPFPVGRLLCLRIDVDASRPVDAIGAVVSVRLSDDDELGTMIVTLKGMLPEAQARWEQFITSLPNPTFPASTALQPSRPQVDVIPKDLRSLIKLVTRELPRQWAVVHSTDRLAVGTELDVSIEHPETKARIRMPGRVHEASFRDEGQEGNLIVAFQKLSKQGTRKLRRFAMTGRCAA